MAGMTVSTGIPRQNRRLCGCGPLKQAGSKSDSLKAVYIHAYEHVNVDVDVDVLVHVDGISSSIQKERSRLP